LNSLFGSPPGNGGETKDLNAASYRFSQIPNRLKTEMQHALTSDFLTNLMNDLETKCIDLVTEEPFEKGKKITVNLADGYCRLVCHGVAAFYKLLSSSVDDPTTNERVTVMSLPNKPVELPTQTLLSHLGGGKTASIYASLERGAVPAEYKLQKLLTAKRRPISSPVLHFALPPSSNQQQQRNNSPPQHHHQQHASGEEGSHGREFLLPLAARTRVYRWRAVRKRRGILSY
jgi:hypothetical protein